MATPHEHEILDWLELISRHCEGRLTAAEAEQMTEQILNNDRLRWHYLEVMDAEASIALQARRAAQEASGLPVGDSLVDLEAIMAAPRSPGDDVGQAILQPTGRPSTVSVVARAIEWRHHPIRFWGTVATLTFFFLATLVVWVAPWRQARHQVAQPLQASDGGRPIFVARVLGSHAASEQSGSAPIFAGSHLRLGQTVRLASGFTKIRFATGTTVLLEGPAELRLDGQNAGYLALGKLFARVESPQAAGFTVETPRAAFTDLGTQFGVICHSDGTVETHVLQGKVEAQPMQQGKPHGQATQLRQGEALVFNQTDGMLRSAALASHFRRRLLPVHPFSSEGDGRTGLAIQFDFSNDRGGYSGTQSPAHVVDHLASSQNTWNTVSNDSSRLFFADGTPATGIAINLGRQEFASGAINWNVDVFASWGPDFTGIYKTGLMADWLHTMTSDNLGVRVSGLPVGTYAVYALVREQNNADRTYSVAIGTNSSLFDVDADQIEPGLTRIDGTSGAPDSWSLGQNYFKRVVVIGKPTDLMTVIVDPRNEKYATLQGLQIVAIENESKQE